MREDLALTEASKLRFGPEIVWYPSHVRGRSSDECGRSAERISSSEAADSIMSSVRQWAAKQEDDLTVLVCDYVGDGAVEQGKESYRRQIGECFSNQQLAIENHR